MDHAQGEQDLRLRILTINSHQPYLHLLGGLSHRFTVIDRGLKGFSCRWDSQVRPLPPLFTRASLSEAAAEAAQKPFDVALAHNVTDLLTLKELCPRLVMLFHCTLTGRVAYERSHVQPAEFAARIADLLGHIPVQVVFITRLKADSWPGITGRIIEPGIPLDAYQGYRGSFPAVLRVANLQKRRNALLNHSLQQRVLRGVATTLLGYNPDVPHSRLAGSWDELRQAYRDFRCFLITNHAELEDGFNLALLEAMATGMPAVTTPHPTSPVQHGYNGLVGETDQQLRQHVSRLIHERDWALNLGTRARQTVAEQFPYAPFLQKWDRLFREVAQSSVRQSTQQFPRPHSDRARTTPVPYLTLIPGGCRDD
jgi:hypothetical protein